MRIIEIVWVGMVLLFFAGTYLFGLGITQGSGHPGEVSPATILANCAAVSLFLMLAVTSAIALVCLRRRAERIGDRSQLVLVVGIFLFLHGVLTTGFLLTVWTGNYIFYFMDFGIVALTVGSLAAVHKT